MKDICPIRNKLWNIRAKKGIRQIDLAKAAGMSRETLIAIEKGHTIPTLLTALQLAKALEVYIGVLFSLTPTTGEDTDSSQQSILYGLEGDSPAAVLDL
jgi:putative transcriptional regulator